MQTLHTMAACNTCGRGLPVSEMVFEEGYLYCNNACFNSRDKQRYFCANCGKEGLSRNMIFNNGVFVCDIVCGNTHSKSRVHLTSDGGCCDGENQ